MPNPPDSHPEPDTKIAKAADSYQPTEVEESVIAKMGEQMKTEIPVPQLRKSKDGRSLLLSHPNQAIGWGLLMNALGTTDIHFAEGVLTSLR